MVPLASASLGTITIPPQWPATPATTRASTAQDRQISSALLATLLTLGLYWLSIRATTPAPAIPTGTTPVLSCAVPATTPV